MSDSAKCPRCGGELPPNFPQGICPACLMQQGLEQSTFHGGAGRSSSSVVGSRRSWDPPSPEQLTPHFPQLEILELLGQGGMGAVYKVRQRELGRLAALKILPDDVAQDPSFAERFQREARALAQLGHQHIVIVYEFGQRDGIYYLLMEYVDGITLRQAIRGGEITAKDALGIVTQICDALQFAHEEGIVHRDIKPENILIDKRGRLKIADFGLAKLLSHSPQVPTLTGTHQVMGTPVYMAPEQMEGTKGVDHRADIFSLGVVFYELLTGELPLGRFAPPSQKYSLDVRLDEVVLKTLEKEPDRRYQQASAIKTDVEAIRSQPPPATTGSTEMHSFKLWRPTSAGSPPKSKARAKPNAFTQLFKFAVYTVIAAIVGVPIAFVMLLLTSFGVNQYSTSSAHSYPQQANIVLNPNSTSQVFDDSQLPDPNETQAAVRFVNQKPELHPDFGTGIFTAQSRNVLNEILADIHREYLDVEKKSTTIATRSDGTQRTTIETFSEASAELENKLWTQIDSKLSVAQQKYLRELLPLYVEDMKQRFLIVKISGGAPGSEFGMAAPGITPSVNFSPAGSTIQPNPALFRTNLRYQQVLGWHQQMLPIRIEISRNGKWFHWTIVKGENVRNGNDKPIPLFLDGQVPRDVGTAPHLPPGLMRYWRNESATTSDLQELIKSSDVDLSADEMETPSADETVEGPKASNNSLPETLTDEQIEENLVVQFIDGQPRLNPRFGTTVLSEELRNSINLILVNAHRKFLEFENKHVKRNTTIDGAQTTFIEMSPRYKENISRLENDLWAQIDAIGNSQQQQFLRTSLPLYVIVNPRYGNPIPERKLIIQPAWERLPDAESVDLSQLRMTPSIRAILLLQLFGWKHDDSLQPETVWSAFEVLIAPRGKWFDWQIRVTRYTKANEPDWSLIDAGLTSDLPASIRRFWKPNYDPIGKLSANDPPSRAAKESLDSWLQRIDAMIIGPEFSTNDIEEVTKAALKKFENDWPAIGQIHWQAAHVLGQSGIGKNSGAVIHHAYEGLKYERDPEKRGWLFMYLGDATQVRNDDPQTFVGRRRDATVWRLKGYAELLPYNLPDVAPELPIVEKMEEGPDAGDLHDIDIDRIASEVRQTAQIKARADAEFQRNLIQRRDAYISTFRDTFIRLHEVYDKDSDAKARLKAIADEILKSNKEVSRLMRLVWPPEIPQEQQST